jgi:hypothetical protein
MARKFLTPLNLVNLTTDPASANEGDFYWNSSSNSLRVYFDGSWSNASSSDLESLGIATDNLEGATSGIENTTTIDTASMSTWRTLKYLIQIEYSGEIHSLEVIVSHDTNNVMVSQYGDIFSVDPLATVTADKNSGIINLKVTPISGKTPISVRFFRIGIRA